MSWLNRLNELKNEQAKGIPLAVNKHDAVTAYPLSSAPSEHQAQILATALVLDGCFPHGEAWNAREIELFTRRLHRFTAKGLTLETADTMAAKLVQRDRDLDDRRLCVECSRLSGYACTYYRRGALPTMLQRCDGFKGAVLGVIELA